MKTITDTGKDSYCTEVMKRFDIQRRNELFCDVILEVGSGDHQARVKAHRNVLCAASPFFYNALNSDMKEKKEGEIRLEEMSKASIDEVLDYLYTGHVQVTEENANQLFAQADYFLIPSLKALSGKFTNSSLEAIVDTAEYRTEVMKSLNIQRKNRHFCDVILEVGSGDDQARLKAHRNVLCAASPFFYTALNSEMKEKREGVIRLKETTKTAMKEILEFLYTGYVEVTEENAFELVTQADYFLIPSLKALSSKFIVQTLDVSNCFMVYNFAIKYHGEELKNGVRDFILANLVAVSATEDFLNVSGKEIEEWISSDEVVVKQEEEVFEVIVKWMQKSVNRQDQDFLQLLHHVRCIFVSRSYAFDVMLQHPLVTTSTACSEFILDAMKEVPDDHTEQCFFSQSPRNCLKTHEGAIVASAEKETICYIPSEDKWYELAEKLSRHDCYNYGMSSLHGKLYVLGGCKDQNGNIAEYYDPSSNLWAPISAPGIANHRIAAVTVQGLLYAVGGRDKNETVLDTVQRYNPDTNQWQEVSPLSSPRSNVCAVAHGNYLYAIGGMSARFEYLDIVERFDPGKNVWENLPSLLTERSFASGTAIRGKVFVFGGLRPFFPDGDPCEVYDPETNMWSGIVSDVAPRSYASAANFINGQIFVNGIVGNTLRGRRRVLQLYDVEKNEWKLFPEYVLHFDWHEITPLRISRDVLANCREISDRHVVQLRAMRGLR